MFNVAQETVVAHQAKPFDVTPKRSYRDHHNMDKLSSRLPIYLVSLAAPFIILFGIRATAPILNPILLALVITSTVLPIPGLLTLVLLAAVSAPLLAQSGNSWYVLRQDRDAHPADDAGEP